MGYVFDQGNVNTTALVTPGAYIQLDPPDGGVSFTQSNGIGQVGSAIYGPVDVACGPFGDTGSAAALFGQFNADLYQSDPFDLMRGVMQALGEAQTTVSIADWLVRITDGTDEAASVTLMDTQQSAVAGGTLPAKYTGSGGDLHKITIASGLMLPNSVPSFNVTLFTTLSGGVQSETYFNIPGSASGPSAFWANFQKALAQGNQSRGPSALCGALTSVSNTAHNPALGTFNFTGGTDGRSGLTSASFFGSDVQGNRQGVFALRGLPIVPAFFQCCGLYDETKFATLQQLTYQEIMRVVLPFETGISTTDAVAARAANGISDKRVMYAKDWIYWTDPVSGKVLFTDPVAILIGRMAALSPELSPLNEQVYTVVGTEHPAVYPGDEIGLLEQNGILVICNPCLGNPYFGISTGNTTSLNSIEQPIEYSRFQDWIGLTFAATLNKFVGKKQGLYDPDNTRQKCKQLVDDTMYELYENEQIVDWTSQVDAVLNTPTTIQQGYLKGKLKYVPFSTVKFVLLEIATTKSLNPGQALAAAYAQQNQQ